VSIADGHEVLRRASHEHNRPPMKVRWGELSAVETSDPEKNFKDGVTSTVPGTM